MPRFSLLLATLLTATLLAAGGIPRAEGAILGMAFLEIGPASAKAELPASETPVSTPPRAANDLNLLSGLQSHAGTGCGNSTLGGSSNVIGHLVALGRREMVLAPAKSLELIICVNVEMRFPVVPNELLRPPIG